MRPTFSTSPFPDDNAPIVYTGFWRRLGASLIDSLTQFALVFVVLMVISLFLRNTPAISTAMEVLINLSMVVIVLFMWRRYGATPGKMVLDMKVVDATTGELPSLKQCVIRYLGYMLSALPLCLGFISVAWNPKKQSWHDRLAGTVVISKGTWELGDNGKVVVV